MSFSDLLQAINEIEQQSPQNAKLIWDDIISLTKDGYLTNRDENPNISPEDIRYQVKYIGLTSKGIDYIIYYNHITQAQVIDKISEMSQNINELYYVIDSKVNKVDEKIDGFNLKLIEISAVMLAIFTFFNIDLKLMDKIMNLVWWQALIYGAVINIMLFGGIWLIFKLIHIKKTDKTSK
jgi:hypothetical protein